MSSSSLPLPPESRTGRQSNVFSRTRRCFCRLFRSCTSRRNSVGPDPNPTERVPSHRVLHTSNRLFINIEPRTITIKDAEEENLKGEESEESEEVEVEEVEEKEREKEESKEEVKDSEYEEEAEQRKEKNEGMVEGKEIEARHQSELTGLGMMRMTERRGLGDLELARLKEMEDEVMRELEELDWLVKRKKQLSEKVKSDKLAQMMKNPELVKEIEYLEKWKSWMFHH